MDSIILNKSDSNWSITQQFVWNGVPANITGCHIYMLMWSGQNPVPAGKPCDALDSSLGIVRYVWSEQDRLLPSGEYSALFVAVLPDGNKIRSPYDSRRAVTVVDG